MNIEWWKFIPGYDYRYMVSDKGRVLSLNYNRTGKIKLLSPQKTKVGYLDVCLSYKGKTHSPLVHRLVAIVFIPIPEHLKHISLDELEVNHMDENKMNNCAENLEWCEHKYNCRYGTFCERISKKMTNLASTSYKVFQYTPDGRFVASYLSQGEAERQNPGVYQSGVSACCNGKQKTHAGFIWRYAKNQS